MRAAIKRSRFGIAAGIAVAFLVWVYDYDFFLNAGGPETPISDAIRRASHLQYANFVVFVFWPLLVLTACGAAAGWFVSVVFKGKRSTDRPT
jgi:hypothetical protein